METNHWPLSHDHNTGSGLEVIEVKGFLKLTAVQVLALHWITGSSYYVL